jgi:hypothetical protein
VLKCKSIFILGVQEFRSSGRKKFRSMAERHASLSGVQEGRRRRRKKKK